MTTDAVFHGREIISNIADIAEQLYNSVISGSFDYAIQLTKCLHGDGYSIIINSIITRLLKNGTSNIIDYAYRLWQCNHRDLVAGYFPASFKLILNGDDVTITFKRDSLPMKLEIASDDNGNRQAWGNGEEDSLNDRMKWNFISIWDNNVLFFKIRNYEYKQYLKLDNGIINHGDRKALGSFSPDILAWQWYLRPVMLEGNLLFYIYNREYRQALKLRDKEDTTNDRLVAGNNDNVEGKPETFAWSIGEYK